MRNRQTQRALKKTQRQESHERPWLNSEGYHDPTAYEAMKRIYREERATRSPRNAQ